MGATTKDTFRNWTYKIHISKLFNLTGKSKQEKTRADGCTLQKQLSIRLKLEKSFENLTVDKQATKDICITISDQPGKIDRFETYFLERSDATSVLFIILCATVFPGHENHFRMPQPMVLPIDILLHKNWVPFGTEERVAARATHLLFYAVYPWVPEAEFIEMLEHEEMEGAESVNIEEECTKMIGIERNTWKRYAELKFVRKAVVEEAEEAAQMMADD